MTDLAIGVRVRPAGDEVASFAAFYSANWPDILAFSATLLRGDVHAAEEVTQECMARVFARHGRLTDPRPYAFRVATNLVYRRWRHGQREQVTDVLPEGASSPGYDHTADAVRRLPDRIRQVVVLHYYADLPLESVSRTLHRPLGTVKRQLHEGRQQLALMLGEDPR